MRGSRAIAGAVGFVALTGAANAAIAASTSAVVERDIYGDGFDDVVVSGPRKEERRRILVTPDAMVVFGSSTTRLAAITSADSTGSAG
jgi:hypothetical protein